MLFPRSLIALRSFIVRGTSMEPNFVEGERLLVHPRLSPTVRNTVVVVEEPGKPDRKLLKRVVGVPGEYVEFKEGTVWMDDEYLPELYLNGLPAVLGLAGGSWDLGCDELFVMGDNRAHSTDSREFGPLNIDDVVGVVVYRYWPIMRWRRIRE